jgi:predicted transcriptional regulator
LSSNEQDEIEEGLLQAEKGEVISHKHVMKHFETWK